MCMYPVRKLLSIFFAIAIVTNSDSGKHRKRFAAGYQDTRNSAQKATINWHPGWLGERDACGDLVGDWAQYLDKETFNCQWCNQERKYSSGGKSSLIQHSKSIKHKNIADRADAVFFIYAGTPGMVYHEQVILNIG